MDANQIGGNSQFKVQTNFTNAGVK